MYDWIDYAIAGFFGIIGIAAIISGLYRGWFIRLLCTAKTSATVVGSRGGRGGAKRRMVYEAKLEDGKTVLFEERTITEGLYAPEVGETVELFYDPNNYKRFSYPKRSRSIAVFSFICGAITLAIAAFVMIKFTAF